MTIEKNERPLDTIDEAIEAIRNGEVVIVVDDEDRENEGDFVAAAEKITPEIVNFMETHGRGLLCAPSPQPSISPRCRWVQSGSQVSTLVASRGRKQPRLRRRHQSSKRRCFG